MSITEFLAELVRTESTPGREKAAILGAAAEMTRLGYDEVTVDDHGNLIGRIGPPGGPALVLDGPIGGRRIRESPQRRGVSLGGA